MSAATISIFLKEKIRDWLHRLHAGPGISSRQCAVGARLRKSDPVTAAAVIHGLGPERRASRDQKLGHEVAQAGDNPSDAIANTSPMEPICDIGPRKPAHLLDICAMMQPFLDHSG